MVEEDVKDGGEKLTQMVVRRMSSSAAALTGRGWGWKYLEVQSGCVWGSNGGRVFFRDLQ